MQFSPDRASESRRPRATSTKSTNWLPDSVDSASVETRDPGESREPETLLVERMVRETLCGKGSFCSNASHRRPCSWTTHRSRVCPDCTEGMNQAQACPGMILPRARLRQDLHYCIFTGPRAQACKNECMHKAFHECACIRQCLHKAVP